MVIDRLRRRNPGAAYEGAIGQLKRLSDDNVSKNKVLGWDFSALVVPNGSEKGYELASTQYLSAMSAMTDPAYKQFRQQLDQTFDVVRQEIFRFQEFTTKPGN